MAEGVGRFALGRDGSLVLSREHIDGTASVATVRDLVEGTATALAGSAALALGAVGLADAMAAKSSDYWWARELELFADELYATATWEITGTKRVGNSIDLFSVPCDGSAPFIQINDAVSSGDTLLSAYIPTSATRLMATDRCRKWRSTSLRMLKSRSNPTKSSPARCSAVTSIKYSTAAVPCGRANGLLIPKAETQTQAF